MEQKRIKVRLTENSPYSKYGYYKKGDIGYIDGYVNDNAVIILENGKFAKADLRWIEVVNEKDKNTNTELKESEDERIRKALIELVQGIYMGCAEEAGKEREMFLAWLEKQGNLMKALQISNAKIGELIEENYYLKEQLEKQGDYNRLVKEIKECKELFSKEKKKAVSTNDKLSLGGRIAMLEELLAFTKEKQGEQKQEWSEEDEEHLSDAIFFVREYQIPTRNKKLLEAAKKAEDWLKSLRPQSQWKPSDEQIGMLENVRKILHADKDIYSKANSIMYGFEELIRTLKKLREE